MARDERKQELSRPMKVFAEEIVVVGGKGNLTRRRKEGKKDEGIRSVGTWSGTVRYGLRLYTTAVRDTGWESGKETGRKRAKTSIGSTPLCSPHVTTSRKSTSDRPETKRPTEKGGPGATPGTLLLN
ncbi:hypothetical protein CHU98_g8111 [Xylaria longipes]|nr:hypothetical protein CHU98_g8111 [Xylaria longipes]